MIGIIFSTFQGELRVETQQVLIRPDSGENEKPRFDIDRGVCWCSVRWARILIGRIQISNRLSHHIYSWLSIYRRLRYSRTAMRRT